MKSLRVMVSEAPAKDIKIAYRKHNTRKRKKKVPVIEDDIIGKDKSGCLFKYSYGYYFGLDMPAQYAFDTFCEVIRAAEYDKVLVYLYTEGQKNKKDIMRIYGKDTFEHNSPIEERFEYLEKRIREMQKKNKPSVGEATESLP